MKYIQGKTYYFVYKYLEFNNMELKAKVHKVLICGENQNQNSAEIIWKISNNRLLDILDSGTKSFTSLRKAESYRKQYQLQLDEYHAGITLQKFMAKGTPESFPCACIGKTRLKDPACPCGMRYMVEENGWWYKAYLQDKKWRVKNYGIVLY